MATNFTPRKTAPPATSKYWIHKSAGGLNECIVIEGNSCLPNCVGYAWGRWYEILKSRPNLSRANAENWYVTNDGYIHSKTPSLGAVACWSKGKVGVGSDGAGHVAIVEEIKSNGDIVVSNSGYKSKRFWMQTFTRSSGYAMKGYNFQGFIHLPTSVPAPDPVDEGTSKVITPYRVKVTADDLRIRSAPTTDSTIKGSITDHGVYTIVEESTGKGATLWGKLKSGVGWISLDYVKKI